MSSRELGDYLDLTVEQAKEQWAGILLRQEKKRQDPYVPVEVILCYALFRVFDPHRFGGRNIEDVPPIAEAMAKLFVRKPGSITNKMLNLDRSRQNAATHEWGFFAAMAEDSSLFPRLYSRVLQAARHDDVGIGSDRLPDFLASQGEDNLELLGGDELDGEEAFDAVVKGQAEAWHARTGAGDVETTRIADHVVRLGQHRFAAEVLANYRLSCAFCGFAPWSLPRRGLLVASHIKPWSKSNNRERLDPQNGVAACPIHDAAFDSGLLAIDTDLQVRRSPLLDDSCSQDRGVERYFGTTLSPTLLVPDGGQPPAKKYLAWHRKHVYRATRSPTAH